MTRRESLRRMGTGLGVLGLLDKVFGRSDDMMIIRGVNVFPSQIEAALLRVEETLPHYQIVLRELETLAGHPHRLHEWTQYAKEAAEKHS